MITEKAVGTTTQYTVTLDGVGPVEVPVADYGSGQPFLLLHGGAGPHRAREAELTQTRTGSVQDRREPGCLTFTAYEARDVARRFYRYEVYTDATAYDTHLQDPARTTRPADAGFTATPRSAPYPSTRGNPSP
ncbi:quinol monooxygenase YgiN [Kitasatospora sp. MAA19]|nr:quinol monooxygenase YgiN [Kitasatospora sp. MAA19]